MPKKLPERIGTAMGANKVFFKTRFLTAFISAAAILFTSAAALPSAALPSGHTDSHDPAVPFSSPAICADAGTVVNLKNYPVQFESGAEPVPADSIKWNDGEKSISEFEPKSAGVYPLTASAGSLSRTVYIVAKDPSQDDYVLYYDNFSSDTTSTLRIIQQSKGAQIFHDASSGTLVLDSSNSGSSYIRVLLPDYLDDFGDAVFSACFMLSDPSDSSTRWGSMIYRRQQDTSLYMQTAMRYDSTYTNGLEIAEWTSDGTWSVLRTGRTSVSCGSSYNTVTADFCGKTTKYRINGNTLVTCDATPFSKGAMGFQTRGIKMSIDHVKVCVNPKASPFPETHPGRYADTRAAVTGISMPPALIADAKTKAAFEKAAGDYPDAVLIPTGVSSGEIRAEWPDGWLGIGEIFEILDRKTIPAFYLQDGSSGTELASYLKENDLRDSFIVSDDAALLKDFRGIWPYPYTVLDARDGAEPKEELRKTAAASGCRIILIDGDDASRECTDYFQNRYMSVWAYTDGSSVSVATAVNRGVMGLLCNDISAAETAVCTLYTDDHTVIRTVNFVSHRGMTWLHQENSVEGLLDAFSFGATMVETDIQRSSDGVLILMHDTTIDRTTDGTGTVSQMTSEEILSHKLVYNSVAEAEDIPTLEDLFKSFEGTGYRIAIEYKPMNSALAQPLTELIRKYGMEDSVTVISFYPEMLTAVSSLMPELPVAWLASSVTPDFDDALNTVVELASVLQQSGTGFSPPYSPINTDSVRDLFVRGFSPWLWTVNDVVRLDRYIAEGYAGITSNNPQWITRYTKNISVTENDGKYTVTGNMYGGETYDAGAFSRAVILDDGGTGASWDPETGRFSGNSSGRAIVFFTTRCKTVSRQEYTLVSEVISVRVKKKDNYETPEGTHISNGTDFISHEETSSDPSEGETRISFRRIAIPMICAAAVIACAAAAATAVKHRLIRNTKNDGEGGSDGK